MKTLLKLSLIACFVSVMAPKSVFADDLADATVTSVTVDPPNPHTGDIVHLKAVVKNIGTAATPEGTVIGGIFLVNGRNIAWSDNEKHSLAPGASVTLTSTGGGSAGDGTWMVDEGSWKLKFQVNDIGRFKESNMDNNTYEDPEPLVVTTLPNSNLAVKRVFWKDGDIKAGASIPLFVEVANTGNTATPAGEVINLTIKEDDVSSTATTPALEPGQSTEVALTQPWIATPGEHKITATVTPASNSRAPGDQAGKTMTIAVDKAATVPVLSADSFVDSIGVNVHVSFVDTAYGNFDAMLARLQEAGVRYVRDGSDSANHDAIGKLKKLGDAGIRYDFLAPPKDAVDILKQLGAGVITVEGANEPDGQHDIFPEGVKNMYRDLYGEIKGDPATKDIPMLCSALAQVTENTNKFGQETCDFGNIHSYPGTRLPDQNLDQYIAWGKQISSGKPIMATETGYTTAINAISGHTGVSEAAAAKMLPRVYFEDFNRGIVRTFSYEFLDERADPDNSNSEDSFGWVRVPNTPKPTFNAMKTLIHLLADPGTAVAPGSMSYTINGNTSDLHQAALQKQDGRQYLILWVNALSYDQASKKDLVVPEQPVTVTFSKAYKKAVIYRPTTSADPQSSEDNVATLKLSVPDELLVIELTP